MRWAERAPWAGASLLALALLAYANALGGVFQFDDFNVIVDLATVHSLGAWWADLGQGIRPLLKLSYTLNWITGWGASGFLATNLLIHGITVLLVYRLSQAFLMAQGLLSRLPAAPWLAAALFAVHPAHTEAVAYICGRSTSLMALLYLAGVLAHVAGAPDSWRRMLWPWASRRRQSPFPWRCCYGTWPAAAPCWPPCAKVGLVGLFCCWRPWAFC
jgi:hypothetical protein